jgi:outer membrane protein TolC
MIRQYFSYSLFFILSLYLLLCPAIGQAESLIEQSYPLPEKITDFKTCALTSLQRAPQLQRSKMEIEIRHLDEDDSRWSYAPDLTFSSYYYFSENEATLSFQAANYRPWEPYYTLQARKLITRIVMLKHLQATAQSLYKLADTFLQLLVTIQNEEHYKRITDLAKKQLQYARQQQQRGTKTALELEYEEQKLALLTAEYEGNSIKQQSLLNALYITMDLPDSLIFSLDNEETLKQILGPSTSTPQTLSKAEDSINLQIIRIKENLQKKKITLAYSKFLPDFSLGFRSPDVLNVSVDSDKEYFFYTGMSLTLWDGKKRSRDITRQKMLLRQMHFENREIENNDSLEWLQATQQYAFAKSDYKMAQSVDKLNRIRMKKWELDYTNGTTNLPAFLNYQIGLHRDELKTIRKKFTFNKAKLQLRHLSGQLLRDTFNISLAEIPYE